MDGMAFFESDRTEVIHGLADYIHDAAESAVTYGDGDWAALVNGLHAADHAVGGRHGDAAHAAFADMLLHFHNDVDLFRYGKAVADDAKGLVNRRHGPLGELDVHGGAGDLDYVSNVV